MKTPSFFLLSATLLSIFVSSWAQAGTTEPTIAQLRVLQTRTFKTDDFELVVNAINDSTRALGYHGQTTLIKDISKQMTSYSCTPYSKNDLSTQGTYNFVFLYCLMRRLDDGRGISVRLSLQGMSLSPETHAYTKLGVDAQAYQKIFDKMGESMFINAQKIEPSELQ